MLLSINSMKQKNLMSEIDYLNDEIKTSVYGIVLMLSSIYFDELDSVRKDIQGDLMAKVDCVMEACKESYDDGYSVGFSEGYSVGFSQGKDEVIRNLLVNTDFSVEEISKDTAVPLKRVIEIQKNCSS